MAASSRRSSSSATKSSVPPSERPLLVTHLFDLITAFPVTHKPCRSEELPLRGGRRGVNGSRGDARRVQVRDASARWACPRRHARRANASARARRVLCAPRARRERTERGAEASLAERASAARIAAPFSAEVTSPGARHEGVVVGARDVAGRASAATRAAAVPPPRGAASPRPPSHPSSSLSSPRCPSPSAPPRVPPPPPPQAPRATAGAAAAASGGCGGAWPRTETGRRGDCDTSTIAHRNQAARNLDRASIDRTCGERAQQCGRGGSADSDAGGP